MTVWVTFRLRFEECVAGWQYGSLSGYRFDNYVAEWQCHFQAIDLTIVSQDGSVGHFQAIDLTIVSQDGSVGHFQAIDLTIVSQDGSVGHFQAIDLRSMSQHDSVGGAREKEDSTEVFCYRGEL